MSRLISKIVVFGVAVAVTVGQAAAGMVTIDFESYAEGANVSTVGDATFSLAGTGEMGDPSVSSSYGSSKRLWNSNDGPGYPTNTILRVVFDSVVSNVSWVFDNEGGKATTWTMFDAGGSVIATGANSSGGEVFYDQSAYSGVKRIEWNNNGNNWLFALDDLSYMSAVPEPTSIAIWGLVAAGACAYTRRRKRQQA